MTTNNSTSRLQILRLPQVIELTGLSRSTIYDLMDAKSKRFDPTFPKQVKLSMSSVGWLAVEVEAWIESKVAQRG